MFLQFPDCSLPVASKAHKIHTDKWTFYTIYRRLRRLYPRYKIVHMQYTTVHVWVHLGHVSLQGYDPHYNASPSKCNGFSTNYTLQAICIPLESLNSLHTLPFAWKHRAAMGISASKPSEEDLKCPTSRDTQVKSVRNNCLNTTGHIWPSKRLNESEKTLWQELRTLKDDIED